MFALFAQISEAFKAIKPVGVSLVPASSVAASLFTILSPSHTCLLSVARGRRAFVPVSLYLEFSEASFTSAVLYVPPTHSLGLQAKVATSKRLL